MLVKEFKKCLHSDVKMYLDEQKANILHQAAMLADKYCLAHKSFEESVDNAVSHQEGRNPECFPPPGLSQVDIAVEKDHVISEVEYLVGQLASIVNGEGMQCQSVGVLSERKRLSLKLT